MARPKIDSPSLRPAPAPAARGVVRDHAPNLGLVCITVGPEVRYRTVTRTRLLVLGASERVAKLDELYRSNLRTLFGAVDYCHARGIRLYRATSGLFPQLDHPDGRRVFDALRDMMAPFGAYAGGKDVRVLLHPDQYVVLNSDSATVRAQSLEIMSLHALVFDRLGLPQSPWSCMILHGGKGDRADALVEVIRSLPHAIRSRLVLENDESCYSAGEILDVCRRAGVPMVFDAHHHAVHERLDSYEHESVRAFTLGARETWPDPAWQIVHISNGLDSFADSRHSDLITAFPSAFRDVRWVEVEAKAKEQAVVRLRRRLLRGRAVGTRPASQCGCEGSR